MLLLLSLFACNKPPGAADVAISPDAPTTLDDLVASITDATDPNSKDQLSHQVSWALDGVEIPDLEGLTIVPASMTAKGQQWTVSVTASDDKEDGPTAEHSVTIQNTPPEGSVVLPQEATVEEDLVATASGSDADEDPLSWTWSWTVNGADAGITTDTVPAASLTRGDTWRVSAIPQDGEEDGAPATAEVVVGNSLPQVVDAAWSDGEDPATELSVLELVYDSVDADGDTVEVSIVWFVNGASLDAVPTDQDWLDGELFDKGDVVHAVLLPHDGVEQGEPTVLDERTILNTAPSLSSVALSDNAEDADLVCLIEATDVDLEALTASITWTVNGSVWTGATSTTTWVDDTISADHTTVGSVWSCTVTVHDSEASSGELQSDEVTILANLLMDGTEGQLADGVYEYARVELSNGAVLNVEGAVELYASSFSVDSTSYVTGVGLGEASDTGSGTGSTGSGGGAGGGGYGGAGGEGGYDSSDSPGAGGSSYGSEDGFEIWAGSGGATADGGSAGGAGGAGLLIDAQTIDIAGLIVLSGEAGVLDSSGRGSGGGSGGGLLLYGDTLDISGALVVSGGAGGMGTNSANDGGGGGGGGRIKLFYGSSLSLSGSTDISGGAGGDYGSAAYGADGDEGSLHEAQLDWE